jgi:antitoxin component of MazEF toxin-antitoxin module
MENLIKIKSDIGVQLTDRELAVRWWGRRSVEEKQDILKEHLPLHNIDNMDYESVYWVWLKQQKL